MKKYIGNRLKFPSMFAVILLIVESLLFQFKTALAGQNQTNPMSEKIRHLNWNGLEVVYLEDKRFPTYDLIVYFADGALSDNLGQSGLTSHSFSFLDAGTPKYSQKEILEQLEFYGTGIKTDVTHEFSTLSVSGLSKDLRVTMAKVCHLLRESNYPEAEISQELELEKASLKNLVANPKGLADRIFREMTLSETPYSLPPTGKLMDFKSYTPKQLRLKMDYFINNVKKRIYLTGPKSVLELEKILIEDCQFKGGRDDFVRSLSSKNEHANRIQLVFVPVPDANQVQLRIGRFINSHETGERVLDALSSEYLGGGFTSKLMREVRTKRGLTYTIGAFLGAQKEYGRAGVSTFTKNETINELILLIDQVINEIAQKGILDEELAHFREGMVGSYPFKFESNPQFLAQLLFLDHVEKSYEELFNFRESVFKLTSEQVAKRIENVYGFKSQVILVVGDKSLEKELSKLKDKYGEVRIVKYADFL